MAGPYAPPMAQALRGQPVQAPMMDPFMQQLQAEQARFEQQRAAAEQARESAYTPPDRSGMEQAYQAQQQQGGKHLLTALAAQEAGKDFAPFQAHYLKQAQAAQAPMKMAGGTMTDTGFIEDPTYKQNLDVQRADAKLNQIERALQGNISQQSRVALQQQAEQTRREMQQATIENQRFLAGQASADRRAMADQASADRRYGVDQRSADKAAAGAAKPPKMTANDDKEITQAVQGLASVDSAVAAVRAAPNAFGRAKGGADYLPGALGQIAMSERDKRLTSEERIARTKVYNDVSAIITQRAGTAQSASEQKRLNSFLPGPTDSAEVILDKLTAYRQYVEEQGHAVEGKYVDMPTRLPPRALPGGGKAPPQVGEVRGGYTYNGGDPANPASWSK